MIEANLSQDSNAAQTSRTAPPRTPGPAAAPGRAAAGGGRPLRRQFLPQDSRQVKKYLRPGRVRDIYYLPMRRRLLQIFLSALCVLTLPIGVPAGTRRLPPGGGPGGPQNPPAAPLESVLIQASRPYARIVAEIERQGGIVTQQYIYFDGLAALVPRSATVAIAALAGPDKISKDLIIHAPPPPDLGPARVGSPPETGDERTIEADSAEVLSAADLSAYAGAQPDGYLINDGINNSSALHAAGITGAGVVVGVI